MRARVKLPVATFFCWICENFSRFWKTLGHVSLFLDSIHIIYFSLFYIINIVRSIYIYGCKDLPSSSVAQLVTVLHPLHEGSCSTPTCSIFFAGFVRNCRGVTRQQIAFLQVKV